MKHNTILICYQRKDSIIAHWNFPLKIRHYKVEPQKNNLKQDWDRQIPKIKKNHLNQDKYVPITLT